MKRLCREILLCVCIGLCALAFTSMVITLNRDAWMTILCTASTAVFFMLENIELEKVLMAKAEEAEVLKKGAQDTLMCRTNQLEQEIHRLRKPHMCWRNGWKSCSSLPSLYQRGQCEEGT